jgi:ABC-type phosphate transport system substrate-binding protein
MKRLLIIIALLTVAALPTFGQVAVIVNKSVPDTMLTVSALGDIYQLNVKAWHDGTLINVYWLREARSEEEAFAALLGMKPLDFRKIWMRAQLSGDGKAPAISTSNEQMIRDVATHLGAIGFVDSAKVTSAVKVIRIVK